MFHNKLSLLVIFFFALASANLGVRPENESLTLENLECYAQNGVSLVFSTLWDQDLGAIPTFADNYNRAKTAGIANYDAVININDHTLPETICTQAVHAIPAEFNGRVWISFNFDWVGTFARRMSYLDLLIQSCQKHGLKMGIYSDALTWANVFGDEKASSGTAQAVPLFYENDDNNASFDDFSSASFGAWTAPTMKAFAGETKGFCSTDLITKSFF